MITDNSAARQSIRQRRQKIYSYLKIKALLLSASVPFLFLVLTSCITHKGSFLLSNQAKEPIAQALVTVCGQTIKFKDVQPSYRVSGSYKVKSDSHYDVRIEFSSGTVLKKELGYVTNGLDFYHEIIVTDANIEISDDKSNF